MCHFPSLPLLIVPPQLDVFVVVVVVVVAVAVELVVVLSPLLY
jgi:hypothetical protein